MDLSVFKLSEAERADLELQENRGGRKQRQRARAILESQTQPDTEGFKFDSEQALNLVTEWAWTNCASSVQKHASLAYNDQLAVLEKAKVSADYASTSLKELASLGDNGRYPGNMQQELANKLGEPLFPKPQTFTVPFDVSKHKRKRDDPQTETNMPLSMYLPHVTFNHYYTKRRKVFDSTFLGKSKERPDFQVKDFWKEVQKRKDPRIENHPMCSRF